MRTSDSLRPTSVPRGYAATKDVQQAGYRCMTHFKKHFSSRPQATGIAMHDYRPSDVLITTFPKSGTTLTQYMAYQIVVLSGRGPSFDKTGLDFSDLSVVSPWIDYIPQIGTLPCEMTPRVLKTHSPVSAFDNHDCRHIVVLRDPTSYPASWLDFYFNALVPNASNIGDDVREAAFHACVQTDLLTPNSDGLGRWHKFVCESVLPLRDNVLVLFYEHLLTDFAGTVRKAADFMRCTLTDEAVGEIVKRCNRSTMAGDSRFFCRIENKCFGVGVDVPKVKKERRGGFKRFKVKAEHVKAIEEMNMRAFGVRTYKELCDIVSEKQWRSSSR